MSRLRLVLVVVVLANVAVVAQVPLKPDTTRGGTAAGGWTPPRTAFGHPDLEGTWENNSATPLERPQPLAGKPFLTDAEIALMMKRQQERFSPEADAVFGDSLYLELLREAPTNPRLGSTGTYSQIRQLRCSGRLARWMQSLAGSPTARWRDRA